MKKLAGLAAALGFIGAIVAANWITTRYIVDGIGNNALEQPGFGYAATAGTVFAGLAFLLRDAVREALGRLGVLAVIVIGAGVSYLVSDPHIATASCVAVLVSEFADSVVYEPLRKKAWALAVLASNTVGAILDTVAFLALAGIPIWANAPGQLLGKIAWATLVPLGLLYAVRSARGSTVPKSVRLSPPEWCDHNCRYTHLCGRA